jgi:hypothetical protein
MPQRRNLLFFMGIVMDNPGLIQTGSTDSGNPGTYAGLFRVGN